MAWSCSSWFLWYKRCISTGYSRSFLILSFMSCKNVKRLVFSQKEILFSSRYGAQSTQFSATNCCVCKKNQFRKTANLHHSEKKICQKMLELWIQGQKGLWILKWRKSWLTWTVVQEWTLSWRLKDKRLLAWASQTLTTSPWALPLCILMLGRPFTGLVVIPLRVGIEKNIFDVRIINNYSPPNKLCRPAPFHSLWHALKWRKLVQWLHKWSKRDSIHLRLGRSGICRRLGRCA